MRDMAAPSPFRRILILLLSNKHLATDSRFDLQPHEFIGAGLVCSFSVRQDLIHNF